MSMILYTTRFFPEDEDLSVSVAIPRSLFNFC